MADERQGGALAIVFDRILGGRITTLEEAVELYGQTAFELTQNEGLLKERIAELELALEDSGWSQLGGDYDREFSRAALDTIARTARLYWLKNPLVKRAVYTQTSYVFGQGMEVSADDEAVDEVIADFMDDPKNVAELTGHQARMLKETELQIEANLFLVLFTNKSTGRVRVRSIPPHQIKRIVKNPDDAKEPWYYLREWDEPRHMGSTEMVTRRAYYPDFRYQVRKRRPKTIDGIEVMVEEVYHVKVNALSDMDFGVSEVYAAIDWARAYKEFLEDWATLVKALSRFAWKAVSKAGAKGIEAAKAKLDAGMPVGTDPLSASLPPAAGSVLFTNDAIDISPIPKSGATTSATDGRRMLLMVSAATGIFEHYFGDPSTGNLATATAMERPMELMFRDRQELWRGVFSDLCAYATEQSIVAPSGALTGTVAYNDYGERVVETDYERSVRVTFPPLLEKDPQQTIEAIVNAVTLGGKQEGGTIDLKTATRMMLVALGEDATEELLDTLFPEEPRSWAEVNAEKEAKQAEQDAMSQEDQPGFGEDGEENEKRESRFVEAVRELKESIGGIMADLEE